jgi:ABC-type branched-subunit amino acid transport system permease subunit
MGAQRMLGKWLLNRWVAFIAILGGCTALGALCGAVLYLLAKVGMPELSELQRDLVFFVFLGMGLLVGLHAALYDLIKNWRHVSDLQAIAKNRSSDGSTKR